MRFLLKLLDGNYMILPAKMNYNEKLGAITATSFQVVHPFSGEQIRVYLNLFHNRPRVVLYEERA